MYEKWKKNQIFKFCLMLFGAADAILMIPKDVIFIFWHYAFDHGLFFM